jgi:DNA-binding NtrC family response regulator
VLDALPLMPLDQLEQRYLEQVSARFKGERRELAQLLGVSERTLYRKLQRLSPDAKLTQGDADANVEMG